MSKKRQDWMAEHLTLEELKENFLLLLDTVKCAVCLECVRKDMVQCVNGHLLCSDCKGYLTICPTCRDKFSSSKPSHVVSQVIDILPTRCKYINCPTIIRNDNDHEKCCGFKPTNCKFWKWIGPGKDIYDHYKDTHRKLMGINRKFTNFVIDEKYSLFTVSRNQIGLQSQFIWEQISNDPDTKMFTKIFHLVPNGKPSDDIFVTLSFESKSGPFTSTKIKINLDPDGPSEENSIPVPHRILSNFIDEYDCLPYAVNWSSN